MQSTTRVIEAGDRVGLQQNYHRRVVYRRCVITRGWLARRRALLWEPQHQEAQM